MNSWLQKHNHLGFTEGAEYGEKALVGSEWPRCGIGILLKKRKCINS